MRTRRQISLVLSVLLILTGLWIATTATETPLSSPVITVPLMCGPEPLEGIAADPARRDVEVRAYIDGEEIPGSPDDTMEGEYNEFSFPIPPGNSGKCVTIVAETSDGRTSIRHVYIR